MEVNVTPTPPLPQTRNRSAIALVPAAILVVILWCVYFLDVGLELDLFRFGIVPRSFVGLRGIVLSPFLHGDLEHLLNNSVPLLVLGWALYYFFPRVALPVAFGSWIVSGLWVWLSARTSYHIGASGVVYGLAAFLFTSGLLRKQRTLMGLSLLVVFLYGSLLWGMFPIFPRISWESHFWGAVAGVAMAFLYRNVPSAVRDPRPIVWEEDQEPTDEEGDGPQPPSPEPSPEPWHSTDTWTVNVPGMEKPRPPER